MLRKIYLFILSAILSLNLAAQVGAGSLKGKLTDAKSGEPLSFVNVAVKRNGTLVTGGQSDIDGNYFIKPLDPGSYDVEVSAVGYSKSLTKGVVVSSDKISFLNVKLSTSVTNIDEVIVTAYKVPLIDKDGGSSLTITRKDIDKMAGRSAESIAATAAGVSTSGTGGGVSIRGGRTGGNIYYIDGIKVRGSNNLPKASIEEVTVIAGGLPANYGDVTSGIISVTTRGPSATYFGGIEAVTSGFKTKTGAAGLDRFGYNLVEGFLSGPIFREKNKDGSKGRPLLGFFASLNYTSQVDGAPSSIGYFQATDQAKNNLYNDFLFKSSPTSLLPNVQELSRNNFENIKTSTNTGNRSISGSAKLDVSTNSNINLTFGGSFNYANGRNFSYANTLFNSENNARTINFDWRAYGKFTQRFKGSEESASNIKRAFYTVMVDYSKVSGRTFNEYHKENFFSYGYVGKYERFQGAPTFSEVRDSSGNIIQLNQNILPNDTLIRFTPSDKNKIMADYTQEYFNSFENKSGNYENLGQISARSLLNGQAPNSIYGLFNAPGTPSGGYAINDANQFRISASGSADIGKHAISVGFEYEQRTDRAYNLGSLVVAGANTNIWSVARQRTNSHLQNLDTLSGRRVDSADGFTYFYYDARVDTNQQSTFDRNLRKSLGLNIYGKDNINIDALDPNQLSKDFFSADELLNGGSSLVNFFGYDSKGKKLRSKPTFDDFFNGKDADQQFTRNQAAFEPIYFSGYIMDKFAFEDIIFNIGLRVDRFDANQKVLADRYLLKDAYTVGELKSLNGANGVKSELVENISASIGDNYVVYVNDIKNPTQVVGYRNGNQFFDKDGRLADAKSIKVNSGGDIKPYLVNDANSANQSTIFNELSQNAFSDYKPQVNLMPRISFSFPISEEALFFAHYDVLTRRPVSNNRLNLVSYTFLRANGTTAGTPIANPNLRPEKTIDYELGFQQVITKASSLKISAFYRENRDQIQVFQNVGAYPIDYFSVDNLDFGTVKGLTLAYDLRRTGNVWMRLNYTLQFAEGTGSAVGGIVNLQNTDFSTLRTVAPLNFDQRHKFNATIDYRYAIGEEYNGPVINGVKILEGFGANFTVDLGSGTPYSGSNLTFSAAQGGGILKGSINGSRLPWQFRTDLQFDKDIPLIVKGDGDASKKLNLNVYLLFNNLFNTRNIIGVNRATGNPTDDGYLADARNQNLIAQQQNEGSFRDYYNLFLQDPSNFSAPRTVRLGVKLDF